MTQAANPFGAPDPAFWDKYIKGRPYLAESLLQRVWDYHAEKGGSFSLIHEPGAGAAVHTRRLAKRFDHIIVSDIDPDNVEIAKGHLKDLENVTYRVAKLEDIHGLSEESVDMVLASNCTHFADTDQLLDALRYQLKPGGTFVGLLFCPSILDDPDLQLKWRTLHWELRRIAATRGGAKPQDSLWWKKVVSAFDTLPLPTSIFEPGAIRLKINFQGDWRKAYVVEGADFDPAPSQIGDDDREIVEKDDLDWAFTADIHRLKEMWDAIVPVWDTDDTTKDDLWRDFETAVGDRVVSGRFIVSCIFATRRYD